MSVAQVTSSPTRAAELPAAECESWVNWALAADATFASEADAALAADIEEALFEAAVVGDVGFADRMAPWWATDLDPADPGPADSEPADPAHAWGPVGWLQHCAGRLNTEHARFLAAVHQVGHAGGVFDTNGRACRDASAADELGAALRCSTAKARWWLSLAEAVTQRLPWLYREMDRGALDLAKAQVFVEETRDMPTDLAREVTTRVLPHTAESTNTMLRTRIDVVAAQLDPDWARRREQAARARTRVEWSQTPEGTGQVAMRDLSAAGTVRIQARVDALAEPLRRAARAAGLKLGVPALRALACQRLLDGAHVGLDDDALIAALIDELPAWHAEITGEDSHPDDSEPDDGGPDDGGPGDGGPDDGGGPDDSGGGPPVVRVGTVELRVRLSTALGLDDLPAELPGSGALPAHRARGLLADARAGDVPTEWRVVLVDPDGHLEYVLLARPDPPPKTRSPNTGPRRRRVHGKTIIELAAPTTMLGALDPDRHPGWAGLITRARTHLDDLAAHGGGIGGPHHPATSVTDAARRFPRAALERWIRARDRCCVGVVCTRSVHSAEIDHTRDWLFDGRTVAGNLGATCARCHRLKHDGGWRLTQPRPGTFTWRTRLGATHTVAARPVLEPPHDPAPRHNGRPRPVHPRSPPRPLDTGWVTTTTHVSAPDDIPTPSHRQPSTSRAPGLRDPDDEPPF